MFTLIFSMLFLQIAPDRAAPAERVEPKEVRPTTFEDFGEGVTLATTEYEDLYVLTFIPDEAYESKDPKVWLDSIVVMHVDKQSGEVTPILNYAAPSTHATAAIGGTNCAANGCNGTCCGTVIAKQMCIFCVCCKSQGSECSPAGGGCFPLPSE